MVYLVHDFMFVSLGVFVMYLVILYPRLAEGPSALSRPPALGGLCGRIPSDSKSEVIGGSCHVVELALPPITDFFKSSLLSKPC